MRVIRKEVVFTSRSEKIWHIVPLGDLHLGNKNCDLDLLKRNIDFIAETPNCLWVGMGDYCDAISSKDKRFDPNSVDSNYPTPDIQYRAVEDLFRPIKDKCIGLLDGNHDYHHWQEHQHNYVDTMAYNLGVPYLTVDAYIRLVFTRQTSGIGKECSRFDIYAHHGWANSRTDGAKVNKIEDLASIFPNLDFYFMGHVHLLGSSPAKFQLMVNNALQIVQKKEHFVFTGSFLKGYVDGNIGYVERAGYSPTALGSPLITIEVSLDKGDRREHRITVTEV